MFGFMKKKVEEKSFWEQYLEEVSKNGSMDEDASIVFLSKEIWKSGLCGDRRTADVSARLIYEENMSKQV